ncbi:hypothetical protein [Streptomyces sp. PanSC9]|uniref:hypothetical protein n=1 Tax=Streptomyces sp. PanSC9 TaxID=1520461 RepID=UPI000F4A85A6|nr:hypothetical protein [Streptomyces sp. PanSC9]ROP55847.1 hypothetical protein EDD94_5418 [Streptomyces sp. PanSC9]
MWNRTLSKIGPQLLRLRHDSSQSSQDRAAPADYGLDRRQVAEFVAGTLDAEGEAALAHQVARLLPFHWTWPNRVAEEMSHYPPGLEAYMVPATDDDTLASIAFKVEKLLGEERIREAVELALATAAWLQQVAPRARELTPEVGDLSELMGQARQDVQAAAADI